ncbi:MAG: DNA internalization-related competence protein ComEC/Rec2 [Planctomycetaceae bacterium]|nr:DNA internalization-related competence protein ComEC/Rec2 [Planctomycetaceae bacterium]
MTRGTLVDAPQPNPNPTRRFQPLVALTLAWIVGTLIAQAGPGVIAPAIIAPLALIAAWFTQRRHRFELTVTALLIASAAAALWWDLRQFDPPAHHLIHVAGQTEQPFLIDVEGAVRDIPRLKCGPPGQMRKFVGQSPATTFTLRVDRIHTDAGPRPATGSLAVRLPHLDQRINWGDHIRCQGWFSPIGPTMNPGTFDFRAMMHERGIAGRLALAHRANYQPITSSDHRPPWWRAAHIQLVTAANRALQRDLPVDVRPGTQALLEAVVLGQRSSDLTDVSADFRKTGLAHLLSISGLHLGVIAAGAWFFVQLITGRPRRAAIGALLVTILYLMIVPGRVPILRAGIMCAVFCCAAASGQRLRGASVIALACWLLLLWRPDDLYDAGFQLSFGVVAALMAFVPCVVRALDPLPPLTTHPPAGLRRFVVGYLAVSIVSWFIAMPLVAYHFHLISPTAILLSALMLPFVAAMLWLGLLKMIVTCLWAPAGKIVAVPLIWFTQASEWIVHRAADLPGSWMMLLAPTLPWTVTTLLVIVLILSGWFARRRAAAVGCLILCAVWLLLPRPPAAPDDQPQAATVTMFSVGAGSCYLVESRGQALVFDCGSAFFPDVVTHSVGPALRALDVRRIDTLILSHPDLDHFSGAIELIESFRVRRVLLTQTFLDDARAKPWAAAAHLIDWLDRHHVSHQTITAGWRRALGDVSLHAIWPPPDVDFDHDNDASIVLSVRAAHRRVLLCGDIQTDAMQRMLDADLDLAADVTDLPHHGSFVPLAPTWLARVNPSIVLQSASMARLRRDRWAPALTSIDRYVTAHHDMVRLHIGASGRLAVTTHHDPPLPGLGRITGGR